MIPDNPPTDSPALPQFFLVGGAVRDACLGLPVKDRDWVVVGATPEWMIQQGFKPVGADFPVFIQPKTGEEYALARTERKTGRGYQGFTFHCAPDVTLADDLQRRDLTINALAQTPDGHLIDPTGGLSDLKAKKLRHIADAFIEDPLRVLRVARFYARFQPLGFTIAQETLCLMQEIAQSGELDALTQERVLQELLNALSTPAPICFFDALIQCDALQTLLPDLAALWACKIHQKRAYEALNIAIASNYAIDIRFACLTQGLAHIDKLEHFCQNLKVPRHLLELAQLTHNLTEFAQAAPENPTAETLLTLLESSDAFRRPERFMNGLKALRCQISALEKIGAPAINDPTTVLQKAFEAAKAVSGKTIQAHYAATGTPAPKGKAMGEVISAQRAKMISNALR
jgi:tRNA nucleotidyltransferase (CCA-adding enzyme)